MKSSQDFVTKLQDPVNVWPANFMSGAFVYFQMAMFAANSRGPSSRPSTSGSQTRSQRHGDDAARPKSAVASYDLTDIVITNRLASAEIASNGKASSMQRLPAPDYGVDHDISEMHPHMVTPEPNDIDEFDGMLFITC